MEDILIIKRVQNGDSEAFALLVSRYHRNLLNFIFRLIGDTTAVEDIGQEVFLDAFRTLSNFDLERGVPFAAWLFTLARNRCFSELRRRGKRQFIELDAAGELCAAGLSAEELLLHREHHAALHDSLNQLPEVYRTALLLGLSGQSLVEIAADQTVSVGTVKSRLFRAKGMIRTLLKDVFGGTNHERI
ncbi:MAG: sigma-70 family RNA polymerase sigma factor [Desulfobacterales bacterium]|nr:sigma-70 family RNA polymerase sigma factor [Desulfobacterales bacterium]